MLTLHTIQCTQASAFFTYYAAGCPSKLCNFMTTKNWDCSFIWSQILENKINLSTSMTLVQIIIINVRLGEGSGGGRPGREVEAQMYMNAKKVTNHRISYCMACKIKWLTMSNLFMDEQISQGGYENANYSIEPCHAIWLVSGKYCTVFVVQKFFYSFKTMVCSCSIQ